MGIFARLRRNKTPKRPVKNASSRQLFRRVSIVRRKVSGDLGVFFKKLFRNRVFSLGISLAALSIVLVAGRYFLFSDTFNIREVNVVGYEHLETRFFDERLQYLLGQNIFFVRSSGLQSDINSLSPYIYDVSVEKRLPDKIFVEIVEREPKIIWVNLAGAYLVDTEGVVLEVVSDFENLSLDEGDVDLLKGYGDISEFERERESEEEDEDRAESEEEDVDEEVGDNEKVELTAQEKIQIIDNERRELIARVDTYWAEQLKNVDARFKVYPNVFGYDEIDYVIRDSFNPDLLHTTQIGVGIDFLEDDVSKYVWESEFRFVIYLGGWKRIAFSSRRDFNEQVEDLRVLLDDFGAKGKEFTYIDLGSELILYELDS